VEEAARDLGLLVCNYELHATDKAVSPEVVGMLSAHYAKLMHRAVLVCTQQSLLGLKRRVGSRPIAGIVQVERPFSYFHTNPDPNPDPNPNSKP